MNRAIAKGDAELMMSAGIFMHTIAGLMIDNSCEEADEDGRPFLNPFRMEGLMRGMQLAAASLEERSEWLTKITEKEDAEEEKLTKAALARRQGRDKPGEGTVGAEFGTQRAA